MKRDPENYRRICETVLGSTIAPIDFARLRRTNLAMDPDASDALYESALSENTPFTVIQAPSGAGKSRLVEGRVRKLVESGIAPSEILVLSVSLTRASQLAGQVPGILAMPFNEFTQGLFDANIPMVQSAGRHVSIAALQLGAYDPDAPDCFRGKTADELILALQIDDPLERWIRLTELSNQKTDDVIELVSHAGYACHEIKSTVVQNRVYKFRNDPFEAKTIIVDGVHNMPLPVLCSVLEYAYRFRSSLFMTGEPKECICEFNMAYAEAVNRLIARPGVQIIRLSDRSSLPGDIRSVLTAKNDVRLPSTNVMLDYQVWKDAERRDPLITAVTEAAVPDLEHNIRMGLQSMVLVRSQRDAAVVKDAIRRKSPWLAADEVLVDLTRAEQGEAVRSRCLVGWYPYLHATYRDGLSMRQLFGELYNMLSTDVARMQDKARLKKSYEHARDGLLAWADAHFARFNGYDAIVALDDAIRLMIEMEAEDEQLRFREIHEQGARAQSAPVVLSTIHGAINLHSDYVLLVMAQDTGYPDLPLWKVALSRAKAKERIAVVTNDRVKSPYQLYLLERADA